MSTIQGIVAREILDSRGNPTVEAEVVLANGIRGRAAVASGASTGSHEALELRDNDLKRFGGLGVEKAVIHIRERIAPALVGHEVTDQAGIDALLIQLDGTESKTNLGANAILAVSMAAARAAALSLGRPLYMYLGGGTRLPVPLLNVINGGKHGDNDVDIQEFMIAPIGFTSFREALRAGAEVYQSLKRTVKARGYVTNVGDEGGFAPALKSNEEALELISEAIKSAGYELGKHFWLALDPAASEFCKDGKYVIDSKLLNSDELIDFYEQLKNQYQIFSIEDPLAEDDWAGWSAMTERLGGSLQIVGDDILVTNPKRLTRAIQERSCNSILIKLNQIGTVTETLNCIKQAQQAGYSIVISHRSGETEDTFISHLAVAVNASQIKSGAPARSERVAKYNELLRIEERLAGQGSYAGGQIVVPASDRSRG
ncbi:phosphopyruvate hydratase [Patescibacteria group bacterium]|nr:phosphopyruvate hydratase [Patescibacteria group bacterium]